MSKWNDLINRYNPAEDDLCDLLDEAEKIGRLDVIEDVRDKMTFHTDNLGGYFTITYEEWKKLKGEL